MNFQGSENNTVNITAVVQTKLVWKFTGLTSHSPPRPEEAVHTPAINTEGMVTIYCQVFISLQEYRQNRMSMEFLK